TRDGASLHLSEQLLIDPLRRAAKRELAKRGQVGGAEKMLQCALGLSRDVNLPLLETLNKIIGREIDQYDAFRTVENRVRHGLAHADVGDLGDDVIQAFNVLNVHCGIDIDAAAHQLFDIQIAFRVTAAGRIGVREFVDQNDLRTTGDDGIKV